MKQFLSLFLIVCLLSAVSAQEVDFDSQLVSDVNADGVINILDLVLVAKHFDEMPDDELSPNPDINGDGTVNILDLTLIANHFGKYSGIPLILSDDTFDKVISNAKLPILVDFKSDT